MTASECPNRGDARALLVALGGAGNLLSVSAVSTRLVLEVKDAAAVNEPELATAGYRGCARVADRTWHVIVGPESAAVAAALRTP
jgi:phosphotransferase system IIB component